MSAPNLERVFLPAGNLGKFWVGPSSAQLFCPNSSGAFLPTANDGAK